MDDRRYPPDPSRGCACRKRQEFRHGWDFGWWCTAHVQWLSGSTCDHCTLREVGEQTWPDVIVPLRMQAAGLP